MRELSEYKLLGYYLISLYDLCGLDSLKYDDIKALTENAFNRITDVNNKYILTPLNKKIDIVNAMIKKNVFKPTIINNKKSFTQIYNFEVVKNIFASYNFNGILTFKLPKEIKEGNYQYINNFRNIYSSDIGLDLRNAITTELNKFASKGNTKIKTK